MLTIDLENEILNEDAFSFNSSWEPGEDAWDDDEDDDFEDRLEDLNDLHEIKVQEEDEFEVPEEDEDDHLPDDDE